MKLISVFLVLLFLSACASSEKIKYVNVPIRCNATMPSKPANNDDNFEYAKQTLIYLRECEALLKNCLGDKD